MSIWYRESFVNETTQCRFGESPLMDSETEDVGELFKRSRDEYGRCVSKIYITTKDREAVPVGWVFEKRMKYEDAWTKKPEDYYLRHVWISLYDGPIVEIKPKPFEIKRARRSINGTS